MQASMHAGAGCHCILLAGAVHCQLSTAHLQRLKAWGLHHHVVKMLSHSKQVCRRVISPERAC